jgi:KaiC/GvpD/RAD55 family RecA-like ATPase
VTPFIGREKELDEIARLLDTPDARLVSLVGMGGSGKTRLAIQAAADQLDAFRDGVYFAALAAPGEVLASGTTYGTVVGAGLRFEERGMQALNGVPGHWPLFALASV